jgi:hypothetical protein
MDKIGFVPFYSVPFAGCLTVLKRQTLHPIPSQSNGVNTFKPSFYNSIDMILQSPHKYIMCYVPT